MNKDAYYFPHFSNARNDRKIRRLRKELGMEGYGIYFAILEILRDQPEFSYPMQDLDLLSDDLHTSEEKVRAVVVRYELFEINDEEFFSLKLVEYLSPYIEEKERRRIDGIKGNMIRWGKATKSQLAGMSDEEILRLNAGNGTLSGGESGATSGGDRKESKEEESKEEESKENQRARAGDLHPSVSDNVEIPQFKEFQQFFEPKGFHFEYIEHLYHSHLGLGWVTKSNGIPIRNWRNYFMNFHRYQQRWLKTQQKQQNNNGLDYVPSYHQQLD